jgi:hypothetical protein
MFFLGLGVDFDQSNQGRFIKQKAEEVVKTGYPGAPIHGIGKPGGGPTQSRGDQRSSGGGKSKRSGAKKSRKRHRRLS